MSNIKFTNSLYPECVGCSLPDSGSQADYCLTHLESLEPATVLFVTGSFYGTVRKPVPLPDKDMAILLNILQSISYPVDSNISFEFTAASKCLNLSDLSAGDKKVCRKHIQKSITQVGPKLIIPLGNLALSMITGKSGITKQRGEKFLISLDSKEYSVIPTFSFDSIVHVPSNLETIRYDIISAIETLFYNKTKFTYDNLDNSVELEQYSFLYDTHETISVDIETQGLNFLSDEINTIAISWDTGTLCIPYKHVKSSSRVIPDELSNIKRVLRKILGNPNNYKVFCNGKFDIKFLLQEGIAVTNPLDVSIMSHLYDENGPKSLKDLSKAFAGNYIKV